MNTARRDRRDGGFSLVEVVIGLAILSIGVLGVASLQLTSDFLSRNSADITNASNLASDQMEQIIALPFTHAYLAPGTISRTSGKYNIEWVVADDDLNADGINDAKTISLSVSWRTMFFKQASERRVRMTLIKHDTL